jgi:hypothetical protein
MERIRQKLSDKKLNYNTNTNAPLGIRGNIAFLRVAPNG